MQLRIRYKETDSTGRIFFTRYLEFFDDATTEYFRERKITFDGLGTMMLDNDVKDEVLVVGDCYCRFLSETFFDDVLEVVPEIEQLGEKKIVFHITCYNKTRGNICAEGSMSYICFDKINKSSAFIPHDMKARLESLKD